MSHDKPEYYTTGVANRLEQREIKVKMKLSDICAGGDNNHKIRMSLFIQAIRAPRNPSPRRAAITPRMSTTRMAKVTRILAEL